MQNGREVHGAYRTVDSGGDVGIETSLALDNFWISPHKLLQRY